LVKNIHSLLKDLFFSFFPFKALCENTFYWHRYWLSEGCYLNCEMMFTRIIIWWSSFNVEDISFARLSAEDVTYYQRCCWQSTIYIYIYVCMYALNTR
jgi:hypothetical protein